MRHVIIVCGLPGSGKSYFAERLAEKFSANYISSDRVRKDLFITPEYSEGERNMVYDKMLELIADSEKDKDVVVDGTFYREQIRNRFRNELRGNGRVRFIEVRAEEAIVKDRLKEPRPFSDADFIVYQKIRDNWEPLIGDHLVLESTNSNVDEMLVNAIRYLKR